MPSSSQRLKFPKKYNQYRIAFNNQKLFIVNGPKKNKEDGIYIQVVSLESGKTVQEFLAVSLDRVEELTADLTSLCTGLVVEGDTLLLTTSPYYYYPSYSDSPVTRCSSYPCPERRSSPPGWSLTPPTSRKLSSTRRW